jgi:transglutaminase-like putative cysteine protease
MELGLNRRNVARLVLVAWAVALAWLARRQFATPSGAAGDPRGNRLAPGAWYYAVYAGGRQVGQLNLSVDTLVDGVRLTEQFVVDVPSGDTTRQLAQGADYFLTRSLRLRNFSRSVFGIGPREQLDGSVGADSMIGLTTTETPFGVAARIRFRVDPEVVTPAMVAYRAALGGHLRAPHQFTLALLDLGAGGTRALAVRVGAESTFVVADSAIWDSTQARWVTARADSVRAWRLDHDAPGAPTVTWVDAGGAIVRSETAGGVTLVRSAWELVRNNYRRQRRSERSEWRRGIPGMLPLIALDRQPDTTAARAWFVLAADSTGRAAPLPATLAGGRQMVRGDTLMVSRVTPEDSAPRPAEYLGPGVDLPATDEEVLQAAHEAARGARSAEDSVRSFTRWVARQIVTDRQDRAPGAAVFTLRTGRGAPDGKARLLAAMARAAGFPARVVSGLAVLPEGDFGHSWTEVWLGRWVAADPTFGQFPASAALIRLTIAGRSRPVDLLPVGGSARFLPISGQ